MFERRLRTDWSFLDFAIVLAQTLPLYLLAGLVPDIGIDAHADLRRRYDANQRRFFALIVILPVISVCKPLVLGAGGPRSPDLAFQPGFGVASVNAAASSREIIHKVVAPLSAAGIGACMALLCGHLR